MGFGLRGGSVRLQGFLGGSISRTSVFSLVVRFFGLHGDTAVRVHGFWLTQLHGGTVTGFFLIFVMVLFHGFWFTQWSDYTASWWYSSEEGMGLRFHTVSPYYF